MGYGRMGSHREWRRREGGRSVDKVDRVWRKNRGLPDVSCL